MDAALGNDNYTGTSPARAWKTIHRVNGEVLRGGDAVLFAGGETFRGTLGLTPANLESTTAQSILTIGSYGSPSAAVIDAGQGSGIQAVNVSGVHVTGLRMTGTARTCRSGSGGILFDARRSGLLPSGITIDHVETSGFCDGIAIGTEDDQSQIANIMIRDVVSHDNADAGILTYDPALKHHDVHNVTVTRTQAYRNASQGGIVLFGVNGGLVEHSVAWRNGARASGAVGIWAFDANGITIQFNESYGNLTTYDDGDGFDLDGGVSNSVIQYNYSHDNAGIGLLVCGCVSFYAMYNDVVRYNVSQNDGRSGQPAGVYLLGGEPLTGVDIFNNTVLAGPGGAPLVVVDSGGRPFSHAHVRNNLFVTTSPRVLLQAPNPADGSDLAFQANDWWSGRTPWTVQWGQRTYHTLGSWSAASGAERFHGSVVGLRADPLTCGPGTGGTEWPDPPSALGAYFLHAGSPLIGAGLDLAKQFGTESGPIDFAGKPALYGGGYDIGASEREPGESC